MASKTTLNGYLKAYASDTNPFQTRVSFILSDFLPNKNKQGIKQTEAENIIKSAMYQPLKADFDGEVKKHKGAYPLGPITNVYQGVDNDRDVLIAEAIIWNDHYEEIAEYLKKRTAENNPVGQSWELYFAESYTDDEGNEWLTDCVFGAACLVSDPAYGNTRTRILSVAEKTESELMEEERTEISNLQNMLSSMFGLLDELWCKTYEIEEAEMIKTDNVESFASRLNDLVSKLNERAISAGVALAETKTTLESLQSELDSVKSKLTQLETEKAQAERITNRQNELSSLGYTIAEDDKDRIFNLDDTAFNMFVLGLKAGGSKKEIAENKNIKLPDPVTPQNDMSAVVASHKELYKRG